MWIEFTQHDGIQVCLNLNLIQGFFREYDEKRKKYCIMFQHNINSHTYMYFEDLSEIDLYYDYLKSKLKVVDNL